VAKKLVTALLLSTGLLVACQPAAPEPKSDAAAMPLPTVATPSATGSPVEMPEGTQMAALSMINAKVKKPIDGRPTAGYLVIENGAPTVETIVAVTSPDFARVELHDHVMDGEMMKMVKLDKVDVPANGQLAFAQGGKHLMLFDATRELNNGDSVKVTFTFSNSGPIETNFVVLNEIPRASGMDPMSGMDHSKH
jgi:periplasmic copper chaperone A